jgi:hypothetical protein
VPVTNASGKAAIASRVQTVCFMSSLAGQQDLIAAGPRRAGSALTDRRRGQ